MKKLFTLLVFTTTILLVRAQTYENSWINFSQDYYKAKVWQDGIYRLTSLNLAGGNVQFSQWNIGNIQLFTRGEEQYIYIYDENGDGKITINSNDYIEFYGERNSGWFDTQLYADPNWQANSSLSLLSDTSVYFLTYGTSPGKRFSLSTDVNYTQTPADYFIKESYYQEYGSYNVGYPDQDIDYVKAEGHVGTILPRDPGNTPYPVTISTPNVFVNGPDFEIKTNIAGANNNYQKYTITGPGINTIDSFPGYDVRKYSYSVSPSLFSTSTTLTYSLLQPPIPNPSNRIAFVNLQIRYPHTPDMENASSFKMWVPDDVASGTGKAFLDLTNFNAGTGNMVFYDLTNHVRVTVTPNGTGLRVNVPNDGGSTPKFCFLASDAAVSRIPYNYISRINYYSSSGQSRFNAFQPMGVDSAYIIITHAGLKNYVTAYENYRNLHFGTDRTIIVDAAELYDQFAYGIYNHGLAIRNFAHYILDKWSTLAKPQAIFLIGKSFEPYEMRFDPGRWSQCLVTSFGYPTSDMGLVAGINGALFEPAIPIGRLSAKVGSDIQAYLDKVIQYEDAQRAVPPAPWMKEVLHFGGGNDPNEQASFRGYLNELKDIIEDTLYGGHVTSYFKNNPDPIQINQSDSLQAKINAGASIMKFFGHASGSSFDISTDLPQNYGNTGRYPVVMASSCFAGNFHTGAPSNSEQFVLTPQKAAIAFLASVGLGNAYYLYQYDTSIYKNISYRNYNEPIGKIIQHTIQNLQVNYSGNLEIKKVVNEMSLQGDPMIRFNSWNKPDLVAEESNIYFTPSVITADQDTFSLHFITRNYAQTVRDTFHVVVKRTLPGGVDSVYTVTRPGCDYGDTISITMHTAGLNGAGVNTFNVQVDLDSNRVPELEDYSNNSAFSSLFIYSNDIVPVYPPKYAIHPYSTVTLKASTANPLGVERLYKFELDTSYFNDDPATHSPMHRFSMVPSSGGVVTWSPPNYTLLPNTVYYWRVYDDTTQINKNESSFIYIPNKTGWSQAHFFQYRKDGYVNESQDSINRKYDFGQNIKSLDILNYGIPTSSTELNAMGYSMNGEAKEYNICTGTPSLHLVVIDSLTLDPFNTCNAFHGQANTFFDPNLDCQWDATTQPTCRARPENYFIYRSGNPAQIQSMKGFIDSVAPGNYLFIYSVLPYAYSTCDPAFYDILTDIGLNPALFIDNNPFIVFWQKGNPNSVDTSMGSASNSVISMHKTLETKWYRGNILSEVIGPAARWTSLHWGQHSLETGSTRDSISLSVYAYEQDSSKWDTLITGLRTSTPDTSLLGIDAEQYPYLKLDAYMEDDLLRTPPQMDKWQIYYDEVPECALNANRHYSFYKNPLSEGDTIRMSIAIDNIGNLPMDSLGVSFYLYDKDRTRHDLKNYKMDSLLVGQSLNASIVIDTTFGLHGANSLWVEANPFGTLHQPEQLHFNNIAEVKFNISRDVINPILDVTFDGVHILDADIVSGKPHIVIQLHDENKFLALNDTSNFRVYLKTPSQNQKQQLNFADQFYSAILRFIPAVLPKNSCRIEFDPILPEDGIYELEVEATDMSKNESGFYNYRITFEVINKSTITEVLNYPNPFSTSTRFVFVLTGNEVPDHMKIRIMTVSGKVVREIMRSELGNVHIGRNITDYAWDGKDEFGDQLANGVYLYKVYTDFKNGEDIEHRESEADKYFKKGWGKMYLMR